MDLELVKKISEKMREKKAGFVPMPGGGGGMPPGGGGMPPMPPGGGGGMPPMDPAMMGGAPPMDPSMMGGMPPMPPSAGATDPSMAAGIEGMPPADDLQQPAGGPPAEGGGGEEQAMNMLEDMVRKVVREEMQTMQPQTGLGGEDNEDLEERLSNIEDAVQDLLERQIDSEGTLEEAAEDMPMGGMAAPAVEDELEAMAPQMATPPGAFDAAMDPSMMGGMEVTGSEKEENVSDLLKDLNAFASELK